MTVSELIAKYNGRRQLLIEALQDGKDLPDDERLGMLDEIQSLEDGVSILWGGGAAAEDLLKEESEKENML